MSSSPFDGENESGNKKVAIISSFLSTYNESPLIGVEFIVEILRDGGDLHYRCLLCSETFESDGVIKDLTSTKHRLLYLNRFFPKAHAKFAQVPDLTLWETPTFDFLESVAMRIETKYGRLNPTVVESEVDFQRNINTIVLMINSGPHFRQSAVLDFDNLPDPFGSYKHKLQGLPTMVPEAKKKISKDGLDHIEDPEMQSLMQREINRFRGAQKSVEDDGPTEEDKSKASIMAKLAAMRESLNREEKDLYEKYKGKTSDEINSTETKSQASSGPVNNKLHKALKDFKPSPGENYNEVEGRRSDDRSTRPDDRSTRPDDRSTRPDDRSTRPDDRSTRYRRDSPIRRRSRSTSRGRQSPPRRNRGSPSPAKRRSRSRSPFTQTHERWSRFSRALKVMEQGVERKRDIYDKRPEDHPAYADEWRIFWEKRYKELQDEGQDADNYDYKTDWIPHWAKRVDSIFAEEIRQKTKDLLSKYELKSEEEPKRPPHVRKAPELDYRERRGDGRMMRSRSRSPSKRYRGRSRSRSGSRDRLRRGGGPVSRTRSRSQSRGIDSYSRSGPDRRRSPESSRYGSSRQGKTISPQDDYSGLSMLERLRDFGANRSPVRSYGPGRSLIEDANPRTIMSCLRLLVALEDLLGSLGPQMTALMARAIALDKNRSGASNLLLEDQDVAAILEMTKEKLAGLIVAGLLSDQQEYAVRTCIDRLASLLDMATKKRPLVPPNLLAALKPGSTINEQQPQSKEDKMTKLKRMFADLLAKQLVQRGRADISDHDLHKLVYTIAEKTDLDDGNLAPPPPTPPPVYVPPQQVYNPGPQMNFYGGGPKSYSGASNYNENHPQIQSEFEKPKYGKEDNQGVVDLTDNNLDEFDELTMEELRSLLDNFKNLSKSEQMDLIQYMRKLESTDPEKVRKLKEFPKAGEEKKVEKPKSPPRTENYWSPVRKRTETDYNPPAVEAKRPMLAGKNPLTSVFGAIAGPPPPPPPPPPEDESYYGRYQPPPPPDDEPMYGRYQPPPPPDDDSGYGQYPPPPPPDNMYGNYQKPPPPPEDYQQGYGSGYGQGMNQFMPSQPFPARQQGFTNPAGNHQIRGKSSIPSLLSVAPFGNTLPNIRSMNFLGSTSQPPVTNPMFNNPNVGQRFGGPTSYGAKY